MFNHRQYGRLLVPIVTPFKEDQSVDYDALVEVGERLIETKSADTLVLTGTTGEFFTMTLEERTKVFKVMHEVFGSRIPLIAGTGAASTSEATALTQAAEQLGFELVMIVAPYYTKPNQREIINHYRRIADATNLDIMLYNIPIFTGVNIDPESVRALAGIRNIVGIKEEAELNAKQMTSFLNVTPDEFIVYCGDDTMVLEALSQGGDRIGGFVSGGAHIAGNLIRQMIDLFLSGSVLEAGTLQRKLFNVYRSLGQNQRTNPAALLKGAMKFVGYNAGLPRLPLLPATEEELAVVRHQMEAAGILNPVAVH